MKQILAAIILCVPFFASAYATPIYVGLKADNDSTGTLLGYRISNTYAVEAHYSRSYSDISHAGVAGTRRTLFAHVQPILDTNCGTCHDGSPANGFLDMSSYAATASANPTGLIGIPSYSCAPNFRLIPGDPRRTSSVIIDKIQAHFGLSACSGYPMPPLIPLSPSEIQTIIDWVAGGAY